MSFNRALSQAANARMFGFNLPSVNGRRQVAVSPNAHFEISGDIVFVMGWVAVPKSEVDAIMKSDPHHKEKLLWTTNPSESTKERI